MWGGARWGGVWWCGVGGEMVWGGGEMVWGGAWGGVGWGGGNLLFVATPELNFLKHDNMKTNTVFAAAVQLVGQILLGRRG